MRICYLAPAESSHILKWTNYMSAQGHDVHVISLRKGDLPNAALHCLNVKTGRSESDFDKLAYLKTASRVREIIETLQPDILHAHYASSYGLLASLTCKQDYFLSVWGSDVYAFPNKTPLHRMAINHSLRRAKWLMSTSKAMAREASKYTSKDFYITPFGVDMDLFSPSKRSRHGNDGRFVIGTIKALEQNYGIDTLLRGVAEAHVLNPNIPIEVRIAGRGSQRELLEQLSCSLGISDMITWLGFISQDRAAREWADMDVAIIMSESESFGVSSVEAQACGIPIIYSDIPGLVEAANDGKEGICLPHGDYKAVAKAIVELYENNDLRTSLGRDERRFVSNSFELNSCFERVQSIYESCL